jgi:hypothetical protein
MVVVVDFVSRTACRIAPAPCRNDKRGGRQPHAELQDAEEVDDVYDSWDLAGPTWQSTNDH